MVLARRHQQVAGGEGHDIQEGHYEGCAEDYEGRGRDEVGVEVRGMGGRGGGWEGRVVGGDGAEGTVLGRGGGVEWWWHGGGGRRDRRGEGVILREALG